MRSLLLLSDGGVGFLVSLRLFLRFPGDVFKDLVQIIGRPKVGCFIDSSGMEQGVKEDKREAPPSMFEAADTWLCLSGSSFSFF